MAGRFSQVLLAFSLPVFTILSLYWLKERKKRLTLNAFDVKEETDQPETIEHLVEKSNLSLESRDKSEIIDKMQLIDTQNESSGTQSTHNNLDKKIQSKENLEKKNSKTLKLENGKIQIEKKCLVNANSNEKICQDKNGKQDLKKTNVIKKKVDTTQKLTEALVPKNKNENIEIKKINGCKVEKRKIKEESTTNNFVSSLDQTDKIIENKENNEKVKVDNNLNKTCKGEKKINDLIESAPSTSTIDLSVQDEKINENISTDVNNTINTDVDSNDQKNKEVENNTKIEEVDSSRGSDQSVETSNSSNTDDQNQSNKKEEYQTPHKSTVLYSKDGSRKINTVRGPIEQYAFEIPKHMCGILIGISGSFIKSVIHHTKVTVSINYHPFIPDTNLCIIQGTSSDISYALEMMRNRFQQRNDQPSFEQVDLKAFSGIVPISKSCQLFLPRSVNCEVILSEIVNTGHIFVQQPTHPTFPLLSRQDKLMTETYENNEAPGVDYPNVGIICVIPKNNRWFRVMVTKVYKNKKCQVRFLDYGGYMDVDPSLFRQIRKDFMTLPFQATECYLGNVEPVKGKEWSEESKEYLKKLTSRQMLRAIVIDYAYNDVCVIHLFKVAEPQPILVNSALVEEGYGVWQPKQYYN